MKKRRIRNFLASTYNVKKWFGYQYVKSFGNIILTSAKSITKVDDKNKYPTEEFDVAVQRLGLTEKDIQERIQGYFLNFLVFFTIGFCLAIYSIYNFYLGYLLIGWGSAMIMLVLFLFSFASHFWYFQIKNKKLGCSFKEWFSNKITD